MEHKEDGMLQKLKAKIPIMYGILLWVVRLISIIKVPHYYYLGAMISSIPHLRTSNKRTKNYLKEKSPVLSPSSSFSSTSSSAGDFIGSESGVYLSSNYDALMGEKGEIDFQSISSYRKKKILEKDSVKESNFPPPLTTLRTESLACRVPWVFDRYYVDGRLIVLEKKAKHYKYMETYRQNGRLVMNLVPGDLTTDYGHSHSDYKSENVCFGEEKNETYYPSSNDIEENENDEIQEMVDEIQEVRDEMKEIEFPILKSANEKLCYRERENSLLKPSFLSLNSYVNKPIHV